MTDNSAQITVHRRRRRIGVVLLTAISAFATVLTVSTQAGAAAPGLAGDFNGDGFADQAVGVPGDRVDGLAFAGSVSVVYGSNAGLVAANNEIWHQNSPGVHGIAHESENFGHSVAAGDFNGDGFDDLAVGTPNDNEAGNPDQASSGSPTVLYGSAEGLTASGSQLWHQSVSGVPGTAEGRDCFGWSLAVGQFGRGRFDDLVIGVPGERMNDVPDAGAINVLYGTSAGLTEAGSQLWGQDSEGVTGVARPYDAFGSALVAGNFGKSTHADLAVGVPGNDDAGAVNVMYGSPDGLVVSGDQLWRPGVSGVPGSPVDGGHFGRSLAAGNFGKGAHADLAIGVPYQDINGIVNAGSIVVMYGTTTGLASTGSQAIDRNYAGVDGDPDDQARFGDDLAAADFGRSTNVDLAVGAPGSGDFDRGSVSVFYGSANGLTLADDQHWHQDVDGVPDGRESRDAFGARLYSGNYGAGVAADLAISVPGEGLNVINAGAVHTLYGGANGLSVQGNQFWHQDQAGILGVAEQDDSFGGPFQGCSFCVD